MQSPYLSKRNGSKEVEVPREPEGRDEDRQTVFRCVVEELLGRPGKPGDHRAVSNRLIL